MKKILLFIIFLLSNSFILHSAEQNGVINYWNSYNNNFASYTDIENLRNEGLAYLNQLRNDAGLWSLSENYQLDSSAQNHADYLLINNIMSHYEEEGYPLFTGVTPPDRAVYAGYSSRTVSENISSGDNSIKDSIDSLFSAIYHRLGFLDFKIDEIGIGYSYSPESVYKTFYVYNMGTSFFRNLCNSPDTYNGTGRYYYSVCADSSKKISAYLYDNVTDYFYSKAPKYVIWPYNNSNNNMPVFYDEIPDPLPECSVSGYPVSIQFNPEKIDKDSFKLLFFSLYDKNGNIINNVKLLTSDTDPNKHLANYEFALMPLNRLNWGEKFTAKVIYSENGYEHIITWIFYTKTLDKPYFIISNNKATIYIKPGKIYYLYFEPQNCNDLIQSINYQSNVDYIDITFLDGNTLKVYAKGNIGREILLTTDNNKQVQIILSNDDSDAIMPTATTPEENNLCGYINEGIIYLPCVSVNNTSYSVNLKYSSGMTFILSNIATSDRYNSNCGQYYIDTNELYYPCIAVNGINYWAKFKYSGNNLLFQLTDYGKVSP